MPWACTVVWRREREDVAMATQVISRKASYVMRERVHECPWVPQEAGSSSYLLPDAFRGCLAENMLPAAKRGAPRRRCLDFLGGVKRLWSLQGAERAGLRRILWLNLYFDSLSQLRFARLRSWHAPLLAIEGAWASVRLARLSSPGTGCKILAGSS